MNILLLAAIVAAVQEPRPMHVADVLAVSSVSDPQVSPDGRWVAYVVTKMNFEENLNDADVWVVSVDGGEPVRLTTHVGRRITDRAGPRIPAGSPLSPIVAHRTRSTASGLTAAKRGR